MSDAAVWGLPGCYTWYGACLPVCRRVAGKLHGTTLLCNQASSERLSSILEFLSKSDAEVGNPCAVTDNRRDDGGGSHSGPAAAYPAGAASSLSSGLVDSAGGVPSSQPTSNVKARLLELTLEVEVSGNTSVSRPPACARCECHRRDCCTL